MNSGLINTENGPVTTTTTRDFPSYRDAVSASFVPLSVTSGHRGPFRGRLRSVGLDDFHLTEISAGRHQVERTRDLISPEQPSFAKLSVQLSGTSMIVQDGREAVLRPGDVAVYATDRPYSLLCEGDFRSLIVMVPAGALHLPAQALSQMTAVALTERAGAGRLVVPYLRHLSDGLEQFAGGTGARLARSTLDLISTMYATELDVERGTAEPRHTMLQRALAHIDLNLADPELTPGSIARDLFISPRHLHALFQDEDRTVAAWIRHRRLEHCRRDLTDPLLRERSIQAVASRWGFTDAAHFSRAFRAEFGRTPREERRLAPGR